MCNTKLDQAVLTNAAAVLQRFGYLGVSSALNEISAMEDGGFTWEFPKNLESPYMRAVMTAEYLIRYLGESGRIVEHERISDALIGISLQLKVS